MAPIPQAYQLNASAATASITIKDSDDLPVITPGGTAVREGDNGQQTVYLPLTLSAPSSTPITIDFRTADVPSNSLVAQSGEDYVAASGTVTFAPGETTATVALEILGDTDVEPPLFFGEWLIVQFSNQSSNALLDTSFWGLAIVIIVDND